MKRILILIIATFLSFTLFAQNNTSIDTVKKENTKDSIINSLPSYYIVKGDTIGIIITIENAQKLDNDVELLELLEDMKISCDSAIKHYIIVVNKYETKVAELQLKIKNLYDIKDGQTLMIDDLNKQILDYQSDVKSAEAQLKLKDEIIKNDKNMIKKLNFWKSVGITGTIVGFSLFLLHVVTHR